MAYLRLRDYSIQIQDSLLSQVLGNDDSIRLLTEGAALAEAKAYLVQKYVLSTEFTDTDPYSATQAYQAGDRVELNFPAFSATATYAVGSLVVNNGQAYYCSEAVSAPAAFNPSNWTLLGNLYDIYHAQLPQPLFNLNACYLPGDQVFWNNKVYTCVLPSVLPDHDEALQYAKTQHTAAQRFPGRPRERRNVLGNWNSL